MKIPHQKHLRNGRVSIPGQIYSISKCQNKSLNPLLTTFTDLTEMIIESFFFCHKNKWINLYAFVVMPDHYHLVFSLNYLKNLNEVLHSINSFTAKKAVKDFEYKAPVWQENFFDHAVRSDESLEKHINYVEENPLRGGLIDKVELWPYSSANKKYSHYFRTLNV